jgi:hypothetical protein
MAQQPLAGQDRLIIETLRLNSRQTTLGRTLLDEWSVRRRDLYVAKHNTPKRQPFTSQAGFEPAIQTSEGSQTNALDRSANEIGK